ncbi:Alpha/Beta hydrolase protein [Bisporella sp. PMI_857]|nr:Alpha/Beta hydrolase protein [Bisporella sp. PMI_857]
MANVFKQSFGLTWRKALLSAPRLVPDVALYFTSSEGPQPIVFNIPSRGTHTIPLYVFIPPPPKLDPPVSTQEHTKLPVLLDFHGGGFIFGSCQEQAPFCAKIARELNAISISVDYRLGPAAQFPAAIEDAEDVLNAILDPIQPSYQELRYSINQHLLKSSRPRIELDATRIAVSGFSSGGNLALNLGLSLKHPDVSEDWLTLFPLSYERSIPLLLFYPSLDCRQLPSERPRPPGMEEKTGFLKSLELESTLMPTYLPRKQGGHPRASPGLAPIKDGGLHEKVNMLLVLPEMDTLAEQSDVWVKKVAEEGRSASLSVEKVSGVVHGWTQFPDSWLSDEHRKLKIQIFDEARDFVARAWA